MKAGFSLAASAKIWTIVAVGVAVSVAGRSSPATTNVKCAGSAGAASGAVPLSGGRGGIPAGGAACARQRVDSVEASVQASSVRRMRELSMAATVIPPSIRWVGAGRNVASPDTAYTAYTAVERNVAGALGVTWGRSPRARTFAGGACRDADASGLRSPAGPPAAPGGQGVRTLRQAAREPRAGAAAGAEDGGGSRHPALPEPRGGGAAHLPAALACTGRRDGG